MEGAASRHTTCSSVGKIYGFLHVYKKKTTGLIDLFGLECLSLHFRAGDFDHDNFFFQIRPLQSHVTDAPLVAHDLRACGSRYFVLDKISPYFCYMKR